MIYKHSSLLSPKVHRRKTEKKVYPDLELLKSSALIKYQQIGNRATQRILVQGLPLGQLMMRQEEVAATKPTDERTLSGKIWVSEFPTSTEISDLDSSFSGNVQKFIDALEAAGATVDISATKRPAERAYLMHWAWKIVKESYNAQKVPAKDGVKINWWHGNQADSEKAAQEMVDDYGIGNLKVAPSLSSHHIAGKAIDMSISWSGELLIKNASGVEILIKSTPRNHTNARLIAVGGSYAVIHFKDVDKDKVHWSVDGF